MLDGRDENGRFVKGTKGGPGRSPNLNEFTKIIRELGDIGIERDGKTVERKTALALKLWELALAGDMQAIKYIYNRVDGRPREKHEVTSDKPVFVFNGIEEPE